MSKPACASIARPSLPKRAAKSPGRRSDAAAHVTSSLLWKRIMPSPSDPLLRGNNLSDVDSAATSRANLGLGAVDNTSDAGKPVSTAQAAALAAKLNTNGDGSLLAVTPTGGTATTLAAVAALATNSVQRIAWDPAKVVSGARLRIKPGTYLVTAPITFSNVVDCVIEWEPGAILRDNGRTVTGANGNATRLPYGVTFDASCSKIRWIGQGQLRTGSGFGGSSAGFFSATNWQERRPVLWFDGCKSVTFQSRIDGDPGPGYYEQSVYDAIQAELEVDRAPLSLDEKAGINARSFMVAFTACRDVSVDILSFGPSSKREPIFIGAGTESFHYQAYDDTNVVGTGSQATWASMLKAIGARRGDIGPISGVTVSTSSLVDVIGSDIVVHDIRMDCPGKLVDVSHEHGSRNQAMHNIVVRECSNGHADGVVFTSVTGNSDVADITRAPITGVRIVNCKGGVRLGNIKDATVLNHEYIDRPANDISLSGHQPQRIDYVNCVWRYTGAAGSNRDFTTSDRVRFIGCRWFVGAGDANPLSFRSNALAGSPAGSMEFHSCALDSSITHKITCDASFFSTDVAGVTITKGGFTPTLKNYLPTPTLL
ncbi:hypothetical protein ACFQ4O_00615 [Methylopila musalis]|uniref:Right handed beta helix domain-containing protein n=1 Tax=Methylopila musalis TaxID=1134781 RepID=A0ABW3Z2W6_9HYPH